jgi:CubicO group peptidase (beta-lactamase class C family)
MLISGGNFSYEEIIERDIFTPLNLSHSFYSVPPGLSQYVVVPNDTLSTALVDVDFDIFNA